MLKDGESFVIWLYSGQDSGWNWNEAHLGRLKGKSPKQGLFPLIDIMGPQNGVVKHLTLISIWSQWASEMYNEGESVRDRMQLQRRCIPCIQGWSAQVDPVSKLSFLELPLKANRVQHDLFIRYNLTTH